jgi:hypothetical protein
MGSVMILKTKAIHEDRRGDDEATRSDGERVYSLPHVASVALFAYFRGLPSAVNRHSLAAFLAMGLTLLLLAGCGGKPFNVKPEVALPAIADAPLVESQGFRMQAAAVRDEDYLLSTFDANLILAGILPVSVTITNRTTQPLDLHRARFEVRTPDGHSYQAAEANRAFKRLIKYYEISTYSKPAYKKSREDFAAYALDTARPLAMGESRQGMLFFIVPDGVVQASGLKFIGARLDVTGSRSAVELQLN